MGDRANVRITSRDETIHLYTHWHGSYLADIVKSALVRGKNRWTDFQYLTRIIFCEMIKDDVFGETGFGISQSEYDGGLLIHVDCDEGKVSVNGEAPVTFADYVNSPPVSTGED